jgi:hypothetical protein
MQNIFPEVSMLKPFVLNAGNCMDEHSGKSYFLCQILILTSNKRNVYVLEFYTLSIIRNVKEKVRKWFYQTQ